MKSLTICMTTSRHQPEREWLLDSLIRQTEKLDFSFLVIDGNSIISKQFAHHSKHTPFSLSTAHEHPSWSYWVYPPKPNVWQGKYRLPKDDWWAVSNARNTALCLCKTDWIAFLDDRCVLVPGWLDCVREAMAGNYLMAGAYEKRVGMTVENGLIQHGGTVIGEDVRLKSSRDRSIPCPGEWLFGCNLAAPLEWFLQVNGYPEKCDSLSFEDCILGLVLQNNGLRMRYDPRAKIIEDRTPEFSGPQMKRTSKERFPHDTQDKAHKMLEWARRAKKCENGFDIRELRAAIQRGENFPVPDVSKPHNDWFDSQPIASFV